VDILFKVHLALDRKACSAAADGIIPLSARPLPTARLAGEVDGFDKVLRVRPRQIALGVLLSRIADPASAGSSPAFDEARSHRLVGSLQQGPGGGLVRVRLLLRHCRPNHQGRYSNHHSQLMLHCTHSSLKWSQVAFRMFSVDDGPELGELDPW